MKKLLPILAIALAACTDNTPVFEISGQVSGLNGRTIFLQKFENDAAVPIDSAVVDEKGHFEIETTILHTDFYRLSVGNGNSLLVVGEPGGKIKIETKENLAEPTKVEGSEDTRLLVQLTRDMINMNHRRDSIASLANAGVPQMQVIEMMNGYQMSIRDHLLKFINEHPDSPASLAAVAAIDPVQDIEYLKKVRDGIAPKMRNSAYFDYLENQIVRASEQEKMMKMQEEQNAISEKLVPTGGMAPDIKLPDPTGKVRSLSEFRGKVVLVDFWASWCGPCRRENPNVVNAYREFRGKGFEVFSVSLDKGHDAWTNAIRQDNLNWTHVSDLKFWNSEAAKLYGVNSIPYAVLIDRDGKVIAKNLRGEELTKKLREILG